MEDKQNWTVPTQQQVDAVAVVDPELLKLQQEQWIDFCALGGLITESGAEYEEKYGQQVPEVLHRMTITEFAQKIGVSRSTLYNWNKTIPNFAQRIRDRRNELWPVARETAVFNRLYMIGMSGKGQPAVTALTVLAGHFSKLKLATQPSEVEFKGDSWSALMARKRQEAIEGETVPNAPADN